MDSQQLENCRKFHQATDASVARKSASPFVGISPRVYGCESRDSKILCCNAIDKACLYSYLFWKDIELSRVAYQSIPNLAAAQECKVLTHGQMCSSNNQETLIFKWETKLLQKMNGKINILMQALKYTFQNLHTVSVVLERQSSVYF